MQYADLSSLLLDGYLPKGEPVRTKCGEKEFATVSYKGTHSNEYAIFEIKNDQYDGTAELYDEGVLKMRWNMSDGDREGTFVLYEDGVATREGKWDDLKSDSDMMTWIEDSEDGLRMAITHNNQLVYRGGFNDSYQREGFGIEFADGQPTLTGEFVDGTLIHIYQRILSPSRMIEFDGRGNENNLPILSRHPIYIGGFHYDAERNRCFRNGRGNQLDAATGVCVAITEWVNGIEETPAKRQVQQRLHENRGDSPRGMTTPLPRGFVSDPLTAEEVTISGDSWNEADLSEVVFCNLPRVKRIAVADGSFTHVRRFIVRDLHQLESVEIGKNSLSFEFSGYPPRRNDGEFQIVNCAKLRHVAIGAKSCSDYLSLSLSQLDALTELLIGDYGFHHASEFQLCALSGLKRVSVGAYALVGVHSVWLAELRRLERVEVGFCGLYGDNRRFRREGVCDNLLRLEDLPLLRSVAGEEHAFEFFGKVDLKNVAVASEEVCVGETAFEKVSVLTADNAAGLEKVIRKKMHWRVCWNNE